MRKLSAWHDGGSPGDCDWPRRQPPRAVSPGSTTAPVDPCEELGDAAGQSIEGMVGYLLRRANNLYYRHWAEHFALPHGSLTGMQGGMLLAVRDWQPITQTEIAQRMKIRLPTALHSTNHLESMGYVERTRREDDRRSYTLRLTVAGEVALSAVLEAVVRRDAALLSPLSPAERAQLKSLLTRVVAQEG